MSEIPLLIDEAWDRAEEMIRWSRSYRHGWHLPVDVYHAIDEEPPPNPTWPSATGALAHAWLQMRNGSAPR